MGAQCFHPGDYFKDEFLAILQKMKGHWLYWGHADSENLKGYNNLTTDDLLSHKPAHRLHTTLWFSCATLDATKERNIALAWFMKGATGCMLASQAAIKTSDNQALISNWVETCQHKTGFNIADIIHHLASAPKHDLAPILSQYRLMGWPWIAFV